MTTQQFEAAQPPEPRDDLDGSILDLEDSDELLRDDGILFDDDEDAFADAGDLDFEPEYEM